MRCRANEIGEAIGQIPDAGTSVSGRFEGYTSASDSERKVLRNVFEPDDAWFRTGDLMRKDERGFFYFVDRIGDTFRWKGENVATSEVSETLTEFPGIVEANVYGVTVPGTEGRAGMAAIVASDQLDLAKLRAFLVARLPAYAQPLFLRIRSEIEVTPTFKHKKSDLAREGFDPARIAEAIYFNDTHLRRVPAGGCSALRAHPPLRSARLERFRAAAPDHAVLPASTVSTVPVMLFALSPIRNSTASATSSTPPDAAGHCGRRPSSAARLPGPGSCPSRESPAPPR